MVTQIFPVLAVTDCLFHIVWIESFCTFMKCFMDNWVFCSNPESPYLAVRPSRRRISWALKTVATEIASRETVTTTQRIEDTLPVSFSILFSSINLLAVHPTTWRKRLLWLQWYKVKFGARAMCTEVYHGPWGVHLGRTTTFRLCICSRYLCLRVAYSLTRGAEWTATFGSYTVAVRSLSQICLTVFH